MGTLHDADSGECLATTKPGAIMLHEQGLGEQVAEWMVRGMTADPVGESCHIERKECA